MYGAAFQYRAAGGPQGKMSMLEARLSKMYNSADRLMAQLDTFQGKPYRAAPALGMDRWSIYAYDDHGQERYLGTVVQEESYFYVNKGYDRKTLEERAEDFETAVELLYALCKKSGYLTQGHANYLGGQRKEAAKS